MKNPTFKVLIWVAALLFNVPYINNKPISDYNNYSELNSGGNAVGIICDSVVKVIWYDSNDCTLPYSIEIVQCYHKRIVDSVLDQLGCPDNVQGLSIRSNSMDSFPDIFCKYHNLHNIYLERTKINFFPECVKNFDKLNKIAINYYDGKYLPRNIELFENLGYLTLRSCTNLDPKEVFHVLSKMKNLHTFRWTDNFQTIDTLPKEMGKLKNLSTLYLIDTKVKVIPKELANCRNLELLWVAGDPIIPKEVRNLPKLKIYTGKVFKAPHKKK